MVRVTLARLRARPLRLAATALSVVLGVALVAGTLIFSDTARAALYDSVARTARNVDVAVRAPHGSSRSDLPRSVVDTIRAVPGVSAVEGRNSQSLPLLSRDGKVVGDAQHSGLALSAGEHPKLRPYDVVSGTVPAAPGQALLDSDTAGHTGYHVGDTVTVLDARQRRHTLTLVGIAGLGAARQYADRSVLVLTDADLTALTGAHGFREVVIAAAPGVSQAALSERVRAALPHQDRISTGTRYREDLATAAIGQLGSFQHVLLVFAIIACVVAVFVIYNTFTILIAQRIRELALLRCVGAGRRQVFASVLLEAAVVGLVGAVCGVALGMLVAYGLFHGLNGLVTTLPAHPLVLTAAPVAAGLLLGVAVTAVSAVVPAIRATRVRPVAALAVSAGVTGARRRTRVVLSATAALCAVAGTLLTVAGSQGEGNTAILEVVIGGMVNFLAVLLLSPLFLGRLITVLGWLPVRLLGVPARLAVANGRRNPGRTATTTATLMIAVGLMAAASVTLSSVEQTARTQITTYLPVDFILQPDRAGGPDARVPAAVAQRLRGADGIGAVAEVRVVTATVDGSSVEAGAVDPGGTGVLVRPYVSAGEYARFRPGTAIAFAGSGPIGARKVGDQVTVTRNGRSTTVTVVAVAHAARQFGDLLLNWPDLTAVAGADGDTMVGVKAADGSVPRARTAVETVTADYPLVTMNSLAGWRQRTTATLGQLLGVVDALLGFAIVISLIGVVNTMSLSVLERTRESATLRALGLTRGRLRVTMLLEALLMGAVGALVGIGFGLLYGSATSRVMYVGFTTAITVPWGRLACYVAVAAGAAVLAAVLPARLAARSSIVAGMADT
ncbi:FtsX-like permease family protein [Actinoplanes sp. NPDC049802]|uniref:ABC transporter permease n=1 Tax=Actinoplanes sp. NPDC049802 TaxID=3154742 RepID=UPI00340188C4